MEEMNYCQSCTMPMGETDELYGTEADGSKSAEYCSYCYDKGAYTSDVSMEQMIDICIPHMTTEEGGMSEEEARKLLNEAMPTLKRWQSQ